MTLDNLCKSLWYTSNMILGVPDSRLAPVIERAEKRRVYFPVRSEDLAVAMAFGARLGGKRPVVLMQDTGLGRSLQALLDLQSLYQLGVVLLVANRCGEEEEPQHRRWREVPERLLGEAAHKTLDGAGKRAWKHDEIAAVVLRAGGRT